MSEGELQELEEMALLRKRMADEIIAFAETQREAVWQKVQSRLQAHENKMGLFSFFKRHREAKLLAPALDGIVVGQTLWQANDSRMDELIDIARKRRELGRMANASMSELVVWSALSPRGIVSRREPGARGASTNVATAALAAAAITCWQLRWPISRRIGEPPGRPVFEFRRARRRRGGGNPSGDTPQTSSGTRRQPARRPLLGVPVSAPAPPPVTR
jgi:hypothetical protein